MTEFLAELYVPGTAAGAVGQARERVDRAAAGLTAERTSVQLLRAIFVPEDETCLFLFEAVSIDAVRETARRAAIAFEHIAEAASIGDGSAGDRPKPMTDTTTLSWTTAGRAPQ